MDFSKKYQNPSPEAKASVVSRLLYCWLLPFFKYGYKNDLQEKDLYNALESDFSSKLGDELEKRWFEELKRSKEKDAQQPPSLLRALRKTFIKSYSFYGIELLFQAVGLRLMQPIILAALIKYFEKERSRQAYEGWLLATGVVAIAFLNIVVMHHSIIGQRRLGMRCRVAVCSLVYRKILRLTKVSTANTAAGQIVNLLSNDVNRFDLVTDFLHFIWIMPIVTVVGACIMCNYIGLAALSGICAMILQAIPLQSYLSRLQGSLRFKIANCTDRRVQLMNEITSGMQVIKMYAWERPFEKMVALSRKIEIDMISKASYIRGFLVGMMVFTERFALFLTVITYVLMGEKLTGDKVFSAAQIFNTIQLYMVILYPLAVAFFAEAKSSIKRIETFLEQDELCPTDAANATERIDQLNNAGYVTIMKGRASWLKNPIVDTLTDIDLDFKPGKLYAVVGQVGAGKTSLLQVILKELPLSGGKLEICGQVSYASQEPWLFVSTIRNNILFGLPYIKQRYKEIVRVCALERDFELFPGKDHTLVGERGVSLSGGQRARINLARAIYRQADIYLLDDPLSAVDAHVGKHLFEECILKHLSGKTRILVTHQVQFLKNADQIIFINNGQIEKVGKYEDLAENELAHIQRQDTETEEEKDPEAKPRSRLMSIASLSSSVEEDEDEEPQETQELMERGAVSGSLYLAYLRAGGSAAFLVFFAFIFVVAQAVCNASDIWLTRWTNDDELQQTIDSINRDNATIINNDTEKFENSTETTSSVHQQETYIYVYTILIALSILLISFRSFLFFKICMSSSKGLHNTMFNNVLQATMRFFDTNPSGRILNRFSKDMGIVDEMLPRATLDAMQIFMVMLGILIMVFIVSPWMIIPTSILTVIFYLIKNVYLASAQDIKRLEGITRSPAFSHVSASLFGLSTIRASDAQAMVIKEFDQLQDQHTSAWFLFLATSEAFGFYLDLISLIFIAVVTFQFLILDDGTTQSGQVGLAISQSLILTGMIQYGMRQTAEVTSQMISVERIMQYMRLDKEGPFESLPTKKPEAAWPQHGKIIFQNVSLTYVPEEPAVLNDLNFSIEPGEKIGIVGRTGAGKSSLISALFRLAPVRGTITVDAIETSEIGLHDLRNKISIIPQEPVLFSASLRHNIDPLNKCDDGVVWNALENVDLKEAVDSLNMEIKEGGTNFSVGQRQLVCLARAIIRNNKILVMDEATANVDPQTDAFIQNKIRQNFQDCTVLTIAHRLNTVMDSDKVLVMEAGRAVEFDHPHVLLQNSNGYLTKMVRNTGTHMETKLRNIAKKCYKE